ncbi:MAG: phosphonate metabolism protein/1,5-bisphosphokinase (PRPP-forming) PhnN [Aestuariivirga sp.]|uniref:phosphonate metabolism protein/1,5-bisphosphokinase (PRPP-forming) PhnN n=1 Tax=Aestuariivirga sp. TaxID=2650926 RepID=UPI0025C4367B|nr:phosphonate metabolism protein/1,5-bisphosphokinase (PRPP-forming) PhnN [Aestuariivirga sp.]MCA3560316.1 phosphonate metabolism protein/1,5-bisphosphokinase (PRPP-forming) PhnN [Aestuariivirga sp.]
MAVANGHLILVVGPSGAGKDAVMTGARAALKPEDNVVFPRRFVTRLSNPDTEDHVSMTEMEFAVAVADGAFALWWRAHGNSYGIGRFVESHLDSGATVVVNCSRASVADARDRFADMTVIEITAPEDVLVSRIVARGRETAGQARERVTRKAPDYPPGVRVERIVNDRTLGEAVAEFCAILRSLKGAEPRPGGSAISLRAS